MVKVYLSIGSNIGNREENLNKAISELTKGFKVLKKSSVYETEPMYFKKQNKFLNQVVLIETKLEPFELLLKLRDIEKKIGRKKRQKYGPREIDIDILYYENMVLKEKELQIPHPKIYERKFVLYPLEEIATDFIDPVLKENVSKLKEKVRDFKEEVFLWK